MHTLSFSFFFLKNHLHVILGKTWYTEKRLSSWPKKKKKTQETKWVPKPTHPPPKPHPQKSYPSNCVFHIL